ncbi:Cysteinyl-tRNA synthetase [Hordeum vulgare]|nr:Cysteinyl-tRNA synthetase [Hordeum vulgare]
MKVADQEEDEAEQTAPGLNITEAEEEFAITQAEETTEQQDILESIQDEAYVEANSRFLQQKQAEDDMLFAKLKADMEKEAEAGTEQPKTPEGAELQLPSMYPSKGTKMIYISHKE